MIFVFFLVLDPVTVKLPSNLRFLASFQQELLFARDTAYFESLKMKFKQSLKLFHLMSFYEILRITLSFSLLNQLLSFKLMCCFILIGVCKFISNILIAPIYTLGSLQILQ